jgi:CelD/BcsL family acetyltransferase involved in cellulose biosynthesis
MHAESTRANTASGPEWTQSAQRFTEIAPLWDELAGAQPWPFLRSDWIQPWLDTFASSAPTLCLDWRGRELMGGAVLRSTSLGVRSITNVHTPFYSFTARDADSLRNVAQGVIGRGGVEARIDLIEQDDPLLDALREAARVADKRVYVRERQASPLVDTSTTREAFRELTQPRWGAPLDRFRRKLVREHGASFHLLEQPENVATVLEKGFAVEASGWKGRAGTAVLSTPETASFYRAVAANFAARGTLRLSWIEVAGRMIAFDLSIEHRRRLFLVKTGYDEGFRAFAPGLLLRLAVIEACLDSDIVAHELLGGEDPWKAKFATSSRRRFAVSIVKSAIEAWALRRYFDLVHPRLRRGRTLAARVGSRLSQVGARTIDS